MNEASPAKSDWLTLSSRLTAFMESPDPDKSWWEELLGEPPETQIKTPKTPLVQNQGTFEGGRLLYANQLGVLSWVLSVPMEAPNPRVVPSDWAHNSWQPFIDLMKKWLSMAPPLTRLAFGCTLLLPVSDMKSGFTTVSNYLPFKLDPETTSDFIYQINHPRDSKSLPGVKLNRLNKWSVLKVVSFQVTVGGQNPPFSSKLANIENAFCQLELDINTSPEFSGTLAADKLNELLDELVSTAKEITLNGDKQ